MELEAERNGIKLIKLINKLIQSQANNPEEQEEAARVAKAAAHAAAEEMAERVVKAAARTVADDMIG